MVETMSIHFIENRVLLHKDSVIFLIKGLYFAVEYINKK